MNGERKKRNRFCVVRKSPLSGPFSAPSVFLHTVLPRLFFFETSQKARQECVATGHTPRDRADDMFGESGRGLECGA